MGEYEVRPCKFGGNVECTRSDRGRSDCYVCSEVRAALSTLSRLQREWGNMVGELGRTRAENQRLRADLEAAQNQIGILIEERDVAAGR